MTHRYLLAVDGGGIRGILPLAALAKLEQTTGRLTRDLFSFVGGTSAGAVITGGIAAGIPAATMLDLFVNLAHEVFPQRPWNSLKRVLFGSMYSIDTLHNLIRDTLGPARDWTLNDSPIDLLITAKRVSDGMPWYFVRDNPGNTGRTGHVSLAGAVTASAAAPTFFPPWKIDDSGRPPGQEPIGTLVDGGVGVAGNPIYQTCVEAFYYSEGYTPEETTAVSLGTGRFLTISQPRWIWEWLSWAVGELLRSPGEQQTEIVQRHFSQMPFYRLDPRLDRPIDLDDVGSIDHLLALGEQFAAKIDWDAIFDGRPSPFRIEGGNTLYPQYAC